MRRNRLCPSDPPDCVPSDGLSSIGSEIELTARLHLIAKLNRTTSMDWVRLPNLRGRAYCAQSASLSQTARGSLRSVHRLVYYNTFFASCVWRAACFKIKYSTSILSYCTLVTFTIFSTFKDRSVIYLTPWCIWHIIFNRTVRGLYGVFLPWYHVTIFYLFYHVTVFYLDITLLYLDVIFYLDITLLYFLPTYRSALLIVENSICNRVWKLTPG